MAAHIPTDFPLLPSDGTIIGGWPANIHEAHNILWNNFHHGLTLLQQEDGDLICLNQASEHVVNDSVRILERMEETVSAEYTHQCASAIGPVVFELEVAALAVEGVYVQLNITAAPTYWPLYSRERDNIIFLEPVLEGTFSGQGCPLKMVNENYLKEAMSSSKNIILAALARKLKMHWYILHQKMKSYGISRKFDDRSDAGLNTLVTTFKTEKPNVGFRYLLGYLWSWGLWVQMEWVRQALRRVDGLGQELQWCKMIQWRK
jgi:hypothetical protein